MPSPLINEVLLEEAVQLLLHPRYRKQRIQQVLMYANRPLPINPFRRAAEPLNYLVQIGRDNIETLKTIIEDSNKRFYYTQLSADRVSIEKRRATVRESVINYRERLQVIRKYESAKQKRLIPYNEAIVLNKQYTAEWERECDERFIKLADPDVSQKEFRKQFFSEKLQALKEELQELLKDENNKPSVEQSTT